MKNKISRKTALVLAGTTAFTLAFAGCENKPVIVNEAHDCYVPQDALHWGSDGWQGETYTWLDGGFHCNNLHLNWTIAASITYSRWGDQVAIAYGQITKGYWTAFPSISIKGACPHGVTRASAAIRVLFEDGSSLFTQDQDQPIYC